MTDIQRTIDLIKQHDPDIVGLMEFDQRWKEAFEGKLEQYPHRVGTVFLAT